MTCRSCSDKIIAWWYSDFSKFPRDSLVLRRVESSKSQEMFEISVIEMWWMEKGLQKAVWNVICSWWLYGWHLHNCFNCKNIPWQTNLFRVLHTWTTCNRYKCNTLWSWFFLVDSVSWMSSFISRLSFGLYLRFGNKFPGTNQSLQPWDFWVWTEFKQRTVLDWITGSSSWSTAGQLPTVLLKSDSSRTSIRVVT